MDLYDQLDNRGQIDLSAYEGAILGAAIGYALEHGELESMLMQAKEISNGGEYETRGLYSAVPLGLMYDSEEVASLDEVPEIKAIAGAIAFTRETDLKKMDQRALNYFNRILAPGNEELREAIVHGHDHFVANAIRCALEENMSFTRAMARASQHYNISGLTGAIAGSNLGVNYAMDKFDVLGEELSRAVTAIGRDIFLKYRRPLQEVI